MRNVSSVSSGRSRHRMPMLALVTALAVLVAGRLWHQSRIQARSDVFRPVSLRVVYCDTETMPSGNGRVCRFGQAEYIFKNHLPVAVKLAFPPSGYTFGTQVPFTPQCTDTKYMPEFCRSQQLVELPPQGERRFTSTYSIDCLVNGPPLKECFVFAAPSGCEEEHVLVDAVVSEGVFESAKGQTKAAEAGKTDN